MTRKPAVLDQLNIVVHDMEAAGMGTPDDIVGAAVFLASADADYIVAQTLNVDGGNWMS